MSYATTYLKKNGIKIDAMQKVQDNPIQNNVRGVTDCLIKQSAVNAAGGLITDKLVKGVENSWARNADIIKLSTPVPTLVDVRTFNSTYSQSTSSLVAVTMAYIGFNIEIYPSEFEGYGSEELNMVAKSEAVKRDFEAGVVQIVNRLEELTLTQLQATKTKVLTNSLAYDFVADSIVATAAQRTDVIGDLGLFVKGNNYKAGSFDVIADMGTMSIVRSIKQNGAQNAVNESMSLDGKTFFPTNAMGKAVGKQAQMFVMPMGSVGLLTRIQPIAKSGKTTTDGWEFGSMSAAEMSPYGLPFELEYRFKSFGTDVTTETGNAKDTASIKEIHHFGMDVAIIVPHGSADGGAKTPVLEVLVNTAATDADVTAPLVSDVTSSTKTDLVVTFDSAMSLDAAGDVSLQEATPAQLLAALTLSGAPLSTIDTVVSSADGTTLTITLTDGTDIGSADYIASTTLYDGAGNLFVANSGHLAKVNAGGTAWEAAA